MSCGPKCKHNSNRLDEGRNKAEPSRDKNERMHRRGEGGGDVPAYVTPDLSYETEGGSWTSRASMIEYIV